MKKKIFIGSALALALVVSGNLGNGDFFGIKAAFGYGGGAVGGGGYSAPAPTLTAVNVPITIGNSQQGTVTNNFSNGTAVEIAIPTGAVAGQTTFTAAPGQPGNSQPTGAFMVGGQVFNITATDANNTNITSFANNIVITLSVPSLPADVTDLGVYWFDTANSTWVLVPGAQFNPASGKVTFSVNHLTQFAILKMKNVPAVIAGPAKAVVIPAPIKKPAVVKGTKTYGEGTLLKDSKNKVYVVSGEKLVYISNLKELEKYAGRPIIKVNNTILKQYQTAPAKNPVKQITPVAVKIYKDGTLLQGLNDKIYIVQEGKLVHIKNEKELAKYKDRKTIVVKDYVIKSFPKK